ncbi:MAG: response regulator, partial [Candidatus Marinimicrobia bacterium]|nr:response regulator [Candidatus Neomarinimicrobiota bacterium]
MTENNINISVVDDEISIREMLGVFLKIKGYTVQMYGDGSEALASDTFFESQIVISDLNMPEVDGLTLLKKVKERNPEIICLLITGMATLDSTITALRAGVDDYILKPFELKDIEMIILKHISRFKLVEEN